MSTGNRYNGKFIVIDTTDAQIGGPEADGGPKGPLAIKAIKWVDSAANAISNDDDLTVEFGKNGGPIVIQVKATIHETAASSDFGSSVFYSVEFGTPWIVPGLYVEDIDGGELQIFLE